MSQINDFNQALIAELPMAAQMPGFADYQQKTTRQIPVVVLERIR